MAEIKDSGTDILKGDRWTRIFNSAQKIWIFQHQNIFAFVSVDVCIYVQYFFDSNKRYLLE